MPTLAQKIEAVLFAQAEPMAFSRLADLLSVSEREIQDAVYELTRTLGDRGIRTVIRNDAVALATAPEVSEIIENVQKGELERDIGKAGLETLTIILYNAPITRAEIDYIRGVNSSYILRHLMVCGMIERKVHPTDRRAYIYTPTFALLEYLGLGNVNELPEYETLQQELKHFMEQEEDETA